MANISSDSGLGFSAVSTDPLDADDLDIPLSTEVANTDTVYPDRLYLSAPIQSDGTQELKCSADYVATVAGDTSLVVHRFNVNIDTDQLTESALIAIWNDIIKFGHIDSTSRSPTYNDSSKGVGDFS